MILSVSRRTDIPACFPGWFLERLRAGNVLVRNPFSRRLTKVALSPETVDAIVFWSKDPAPLMPFLTEIDQMGYRYLFQFTLTPYGKEWEPGLRDKSAVVKTFQELSLRLGPSRVLWRYDPILLGDGVDMDYHKRHFSRLCRDLSGYTDQVTVSFVDQYASLLKKPFRSPNGPEREELAAYIGKTAPQWGMAPAACCEAADYTAFGIGRASCIDKTRLESLCGAALHLRPDTGQRKGCGCVQSVDVGAYQTCRNGCVYCYANRGRPPVEAGHGALLAGCVLPGEEAYPCPAQSCIQDQLRF